MSPRQQPARSRLVVRKKAARSRNRRKPDILGTVRTVLVVALAAQCLRVAFFSPRFRLERVEITGTKRFSPQQVIEMAKVPLGENIFRVNLVRVSDRLKQEPVIREAVVSRELPGGLEVSLLEREPAIQVATVAPEAKAPAKPDSERGDDGERAEAGEAVEPASAVVFHADADGMVFQRASATDAKLPLVEVPASQAPVVGKRLPDEVVRTVWECARLAEKEEIPLRKLRIDEGGELWLNIATYPTSRTPGGTLTVRVGRSTELPEKFRDIDQSLLGWPDLSASAAYLNVMCAGRPAYMSASAPSDGQQTTTR